MYRKNLILECSEIQREKSVRTGLIVTKGDKMKQKQQVQQLMYKGILFTQMSQVTDTVEEMLIDNEVMFGGELNRKLAEWVMRTEEIRNDLTEMAIEEIEAFED